MKQIIALILSSCFLLPPAYCLIIEDEFVNSTLDNTLKIKKHRYTLLQDDFAQSNKNKNIAKKEIIIDEILPQEPQHKFIRKQIDFENKGRELKVKIAKPYSSKMQLDEGDEIIFITLDEIKIKDKTYPINSTINARIETISKNKSWGIPSDIVIGDFKLDNHKLSGEIQKQGANRALWLYPTIYATSCFFGIGLLLIPIRGGHAKINTKETFILYYK
ncbi:hypothetical protein IJ531_00480 [bacterium]|nr:hypothetical protein [bacterium]